jgi:endogenous inhibitor of DNA gyrase (YacG/DUF329 family)
MSAHDRGSTPPRRKPAERQCPICGKPSAGESSPFCSRRCADIDLHRWLSGRYVIPGATVDEEDDESSRKDDA